MSTVVTRHLRQGPLWVRVFAYAEGRAQQGHAPLTAGELVNALGPTTPGSISRAIAVAIRNGWLSPCSSARCLVLPGAERQPCRAIHRDQP